MSAITVRNLPPDLLEQARALAEQDRRSLNQTLLLLIERGLNYSIANSLISKDPISVTAQVDLWKMLQGRWQDRRSTKNIIKEIYDARTPGREVEL